MTRDARYDPLFEPLQIGPVTAPNRFYQVPHCAGMGYLRPQMMASMRVMASMRGIKAEGGWGVVCTEYCSIHASSDDTPYPHASLRDDDDIRNLRLMTELVHAHGSLAGVELWYGGHRSANLNSRSVSLDVGSLPNAATFGIPVQSQAMSKADIRAFRQMYQDAARRALAADFDIVYVYSNHEYLLHNFLSSGLNTRSDEYGGSVENRSRLLREVIEDVLEAVSHRSAVAVRYSIPIDYENDPDELLECFKTVAELPDLWDITVTDYSREMGSSRFVKEAAHQDAVAKIKSMTSKPVVSVGRFTSPDTMLSQIKAGVQDFIGAARPSIADPFLPAKIEQGRLEDIRECIGCNVCYAHDTPWVRRFAVRRIPPWVKSGVATGIPIVSKPGMLTSRCSSSVPALRVSKPPARSANEVTGLSWPKPGTSSVGVSTGNQACRDYPNTRAYVTGAWASWRKWQTSKSTPTIDLTRTLSSSSIASMSSSPRARTGATMVSVAGAARPLPAAMMQT